MLKEARQATMGEFGTTLFDGGAKPHSNGYVARCIGGGINLDFYKMGDYRNCGGCYREEKCSANVAILAEGASL